MKKIAKTTLLYLSAIAFLIGWWWFAFISKTSATNANNSHNNSILAHELPQELSLLSPIERQQLIKALSGNIDAIYRFITDWDIDAQMMISAGLQNIERLPQSDMQNIHLLYRRLSHNIKSPIDTTQVTDDRGITIPLQKSYSRIISQTFIAADFLLALVPPEQIVALPDNFRSLTEIYPKELTDQIKLDAARQNGEKVYSAKPDIAFIANYSNPSTVQALANQGITLYTMKDIVSINDSVEELKKVGLIVDKKDKSDLLAYFITAAMMAIDNRISALVSNRFKTNEEPPSILFVNYNYNFSLPTTKTLHGKIIARLEQKSKSFLLPFKIENTADWVVPISKEEIVNINPSFLIVTSMHPEHALKDIKQDPALSTIDAVKAGKITSLNETIQNSPSQYVVLAYFDLLNTLQGMP